MRRLCGCLLVRAGDVAVGRAEGHGHPRPGSLLVADCQGVSPRRYAGDLRIPAKREVVPRVARVVTGPGRRGLVLEPRSRHRLAVEVKAAGEHAVSAAGGAGTQGLNERVEVHFPGGRKVEGQRAALTLRLSGRIGVWPRPLNVDAPAAVASGGTGRAGRSARARGTGRALRARGAA